MKKNEYFPESVTHPGIDLKEKLDELGMGNKEFAVRTGKPEQTIIAIISGNSSITPDMAVLFENVLKIPANFWLKRQYNYDESVARQKVAEQSIRAVEWVRKFPVKEMIGLGWLPASVSAEEKVKAVLEYFSVSTPAAWEDFYYESRLKVQFRISLRQTQNPYSISAWLRKGELTAESIKACQYIRGGFVNALAAARRIMASHPEDYLERLQETCLKAGVKVIYVPCLPGSPSGATRWLNDNPVIILSDRYKRNDTFWFTFFHEAGHILLHGKKDIFLEKIKYNEFDKSKEDEANEFAVKLTFSNEQERELMQNKKLTKENIYFYANKFQTHPAIILGRLEHNGIAIPPSVRSIFIHLKF